MLYCEIALPFSKIVINDTLKIENVPEKYRHNIEFGIDLFPVDYIDSIEKYKKYKKKVSKLIAKRNLSLFYADKSKNIIKNIVGSFLNLFYRNKTNAICKKIDCIFNNNDEKKYSLTNDIFVLTDHIYKGDIFNKISLFDFENRKYFISDSFKNILSVCYGDYLKLPPAEKRVTHHNFKAYFTN